VPVATAIEIRDLRPVDWPEVAAIYEEGVRAGVTFARESPSWEAWDAAHTVRLVAVADNAVVGWTALSPVSTRNVYRGVARSAVYVTEDYRRLGVGRGLMEELVRRAEVEGVWTIEVSIFPENEASLELHKALGFRIVGTREKIGKRGGVWRDTVLLERRSRRVR
jgi:L-amino acid N-acyltransferase YncA